MDKDLPSLKDMNELHSQNVAWALHQGKILKNHNCRAEGMTQWVQCLICKSENSS